MSTFSGGETIQRVIGKINYTLVADNETTVYTVPSGIYAKITLLGVRHTGNSTTLRFIRLIGPDEPGTNSHIVDEIATLSVNQNQMYNLRDSGENIFTIFSQSVPGSPPRRDSFYPEGYRIIIEKTGIDTGGGDLYCAIKEFAAPGGTLTI